MRRVFLLSVLAVALTFTAQAQVRGGMRFTASPARASHAGSVHSIVTPFPTVTSRWSYIPYSPNSYRFRNPYGADAYGAYGNPSDFFTANASFTSNGIYAYFQNGFLKNANCFQAPYTCLPRRYPYDTAFNGFWGGYSPYGYGYGYGPGLVTMPAENYTQLSQLYAAQQQQTSEDIQDLIRQQRLQQMHNDLNEAEAASALRRAPAMPYPAPPQPEARQQGRLPAPFAPPAMKPAAPASEQQQPSRPPTVLVFRNQQQLEVQNYALTGRTLYTMDPSMQRQIPLAELDIPATVRMNEARGITFKVPGGK